MVHLLEDRSQKVIDKGLRIAFGQHFSSFTFKLKLTFDFLEWQLCHSSAETFFLTKISYHINVCLAVYFPIFYFTFCHSLQCFHCLLRVTCSCEGRKISSNEKYETWQKENYKGKNSVKLVNLGTPTGSQPAIDQL